MFLTEGSRIELFILASVVNAVKYEERNAIWWIFLKKACFVFVFL